MELEQSGLTLSASEFAAATGVGRERLRTWERRHGFPEPVRHGAGARRYRAADVRRVLAVRRAVELGVPLRAAIDDAKVLADESDPGAVAALAGETLEHAPFGAVVIAGPRPLTIAWVNGDVRARPDGPSPGDDLLAIAPGLAGSECRARLERLFAGEEGALWLEHPSFGGGFDELVGSARPVRSIGWRLPRRGDLPPLVLLVESPDEPAPGAREPAGRLRGALDRAGSWAAAIEDVSMALRDEIGPAAMAEALERLVVRVGALDAALASRSDDTLLVGRSIRGMLEPSMVAVEGFAVLAAALRDRAIDWLGPAGLRAFGVPEGNSAVVVPVAAAGERVGALLLLFRAELPLGDVERGLLGAVATTLGYALLRERSPARNRAAASG